MFFFSGAILPLERSLTGFPPVGGVGRGVEAARHRGEPGRRKECHLENYEIAPIFVSIFLVSAQRKSLLLFSPAAKQLEVRGDTMFLEGEKRAIWEGRLTLFLAKIHFSLRISETIAADNCNFHFFWSNVTFNILQSNLPEKSIPSPLILKFLTRTGNFLGLKSPWSALKSQREQRHRLSAT